MKQLKSIMLVKEMHLRRCRHALESARINVEFHREMLKASFDREDFFEKKRKHFLGLQISGVTNGPQLEHIFQQLTAMRNEISLLRQSRILLSAALNLAVENHQSALQKWRLAEQAHLLVFNQLIQQRRKVALSADRAIEEAEQESFSCRAKI